VSKALYRGWISDDAWRGRKPITGLHEEDKELLDVREKKKVDEETYFYPLITGPHPVVFRRRRKRS